MVVYRPSGLAEPNLMGACSLAVKLKAELAQAQALDDLSIPEARESAHFYLSS